MTIPQYLRVCRERWLIITAAVLLGLAGAGLAFALTPPVYTAQLTMYVSTTDNDDAASAASSVQVAQTRVKSYVELVASSRVTQEVVGRLNLPESAEELSGKISADTPLDSVILNVAVTDGSAQRAADLANAVGTAFSDLTAGLDRNATAGQPPAIVVQAVQPASVPTVPSSSGLAVVLTFGLLGGLAVGLAGAFAANSLDSSVRSPSVLRERTGVPNLGVIELGSDIAERPLTVYEDPQSSRSESFQQLGAAVRFAAADDVRIVVVASPGPGEGTTTTVLNLAAAVGATGRRVLVVDANLRRPRVAEILELDPSVGFSTVLLGNIGLERAVRPWIHGRFDVLVSGPLPPSPGELLGSERLGSVLDQMRARYDVVLIDSSPLLPVVDTAMLAAKADGTMLVCRYRQTTRSQVDEAIRILHSASGSVLGTVLSMAPRRDRNTYTGRTEFVADRSKGPDGTSAAGVGPVDMQASAEVPAARIPPGGVPDSSWRAASSPPEQLVAATSSGPGSSNHRPSPTPKPIDDAP